MASLARASYSIGSPTRTCAASGRTLQTGEPFVAALVQVGEPGAEQLQRIDFALDAWQSGKRPRDEQGRRLAVLGSWRALVPDPSAKKRILIDDDALLDMFEQSGEEVGGAEAAAPDPTTPTSDDLRVFRFMLALILIRKRLLICEKTDKQGIMFVRPRGSLKSSEGGQLSEVEDPGLKEDAVARVVGQLAALLDGEVSALPPTTPIVEVKP